MTSQSLKLILDLPFKPREFYTALKDLSHNKSPGSDGITAEFYIKFWDLLDESFFNSMSYSIDNGLLSQEQRTGLITLIPKKSLDRLQLSNWRTITLLNNDFKIYSKALAKRIQMCIGEIISEDQTGFIKRRTICNNLVNIQHIIQRSSISD